jgi:hypothetical protein
MGPPVSYVAHLTGALAGLTIGLLVLKNFEQKLHEQLLWWVALGVYAALHDLRYTLQHHESDGGRGGEPRGTGLIVSTSIIGSGYSPDCC